MEGGAGGVTSSLSMLMMVEGIQLSSSSLLVKGNKLLLLVSI